jgi:hypothetical protein
MSTDVMTPTAKLRWVPLEKGSDELVLQQWWSNESAVKMGPANMIKGEWREILVEETDES